MCVFFRQEWRLSDHFCNLTCEQGNIYEGIQGNWLAGLESLKWLIQCLHSEGVGILQEGSEL